MKLTTDVALAEQFDLELDHFHRLRLRYGWPCVKLGRKDVRFTEEQIAQIVRMHSEAAAPPSTEPAVTLPDQTALSAARSL